MEPFQTTAIQAAYEAFDPDLRQGLLALRSHIFDTAKTLHVGKIEESLKWGQPSYTTADMRTATPIRLGVSKTGDLAILTHCQSTVIADFRALAPPNMVFDGNRALHLDPKRPLPLDAITPLIAAALTYHV